MNPTPSPVSHQPTDEEIRQQIAAEAQKTLECLNPDYLIGWSYRGNTTKSDETIRFGDLPVEEQEALKKALQAQARGEIVKYTF